jgi:transposase
MRIAQALEPVEPLQEQGEGEKKVADEPSDHALGRSRGGYGTKVHLVVCSNGIPLAATISAGQAHDSKYLETALSEVRLESGGRGRPVTRPKSLGCDKAYSFPRIRKYLHNRAIRPVIPRKSNARDGRSKLDRFRYRGRNIIERCIGWLKDCRRFATRFEKLAVNYSCMVKLAMILQCFRQLNR